MLLRRFPQQYTRYRRSLERSRLDPISFMLVGRRHTKRIGGIVRRSDVGTRAQGRPPERRTLLPLPLPRCPPLFPTPERAVRVVLG